MSDKDKTTPRTKITSDPSSSKYSRKINNKSHEESPFGEDEPSNLTTYK